MNDKHLQDCCSVRDLQQLLDDFSIMLDPPKANRINDGAQCTLATESASTWHTDLTEYQDDVDVDDDGSLSESYLFGDFIPVSFDVAVDDEFEDRWSPIPMENLHQSLPNIRHGISERKAQINGEGSYSLSSTHGTKDEFVSSSQHINARLSHDLSGSTCSYGSGVQRGAGNLEQDSMKSFVYAFGNLNNCMEQSAQSREMVKRLAAETSQQPESSLHEEYQHQRRRSSSSTTTKIRQQRRPTRTRSSSSLSTLQQASRGNEKANIVKARPSFRRSSSLRKESRTTGVRPVRLELLGL